MIKNFFLLLLLFIIFYHIFGESNSILCELSKLEKKGN